MGIGKASAVYSAIQWNQERERKARQTQWNATEPRKTRKKNSLQKRATEHNQFKRLELDGDGQETAKEH